MTRIWLVNWNFQSRITLWCRHKSTNVSIGLCWQMPKFSCMTSMIYLFRPPLSVKAIYRKTAEAKLYTSYYYNDSRRYFTSPLWASLSYKMTPASYTNTFLILFIIYIDTINVVLSLDLCVYVKFYKVITLLTFKYNINRVTLEWLKNYCDDELPNNSA